MGKRAAPPVVVGEVVVVVGVWWWCSGRLILQVWFVEFGCAKKIRSEAMRRPTDSCRAAKTPDPCPVL